MIRSKASIIEACAALIAEEGFSGVSIEAVAARSGAAKTTIYRHWPSREALLAEAFGVCADAALPSPDTGSLREDLRVVLGGLTLKLNDAGWCSAIGSLADAAGRDVTLERLHQTTLSTGRRPLTGILERAVERGDLPPGLDIEDAVALIVGPLFYRAMIARQPVAEAFVARAVDAALAELGRART
ncbi:MAG: TetR/AcrR family transcriptional regulator [Thermoleophilia bacterium]|nr:TetR/AcrR family transcriptional regulator [Thermoleophilia bacterium]